MTAPDPQPGQGADGYRARPDAVVVLDADGVIRSVSGDLAGFTGISPEAYLGSSWPEMLHPDDVAGARAGLGELVGAPDGARRTAMVRLRVTGDAGAGGGRWVAAETEVTRLVQDAPGGYLAALRVLCDFDEQPDRVETFLRSVIDVPLDAVLVLDESGKVEWASPSAVAHTKWTRDDLVGLTTPDVIHRDELDAVDAMRGRVLRGAGTQEVEARMRRADGSWGWMRVRMSDLRDVRGIGGLVAVVSDVNQEVQARRAMARFATVFDATDDLVVLTDPDGTIVYANRAAYGFLGTDLGSLIERPDLAEVATSVSEALAEDGVRSWVGEVTLTGMTGDTRPVSLEVLAHHDPSGALSFLSATARDISDRIQLQDQLQRQATHDPLTGLPNRAMLFERIHRASGKVGSEPDHHMALLFIDLDHFKTINDNLGHSVGDKLLGAISRRVRTVVRPGDLVGRFGGDEFVVLCEEVESLDAATAVAARIASTLEAPFRVDGHDVHVGVSIGIAFADEVADAEAILRDADAAMYRAKSGGRGQWVVFDEELRRTALAREHLEADLRSSRGGESMELHYQPIVDCSTGVVAGVEALLRWRRDGELVSPEVFMQVAEETGLITSIGEWVIREACRQLARWSSRAGWEDLRVSVNVSVRQIQRPGFAAMVQAAMNESGISPQSLCIEITETVLVHDEAKAAGVLAELRALGLGVAIDDFGTGYSSLTYLHRLPVDVVKLDRSFVDGICEDDQKRAIVEAVVDLSAALGLSSVAEGVETTAELEVLKALGCTSAQGNLLSPAVPVGSLEKVLLAGRGGLVLQGSELARGT